MTGSDARRRLSANERTVVDLLLADGPASRVDLAERIGMSRASLNELVARLVASGVVEPVGEVVSTRRGPNAMHFRAVTELALAAGVELMPGTVRVVVADLAGRALADATTLDRHGVVDAVHSVLRDLRVDERALGRVVVGMPGVVGPDGEATYVWGHPDWHPEPVAELARRLGCPVQVENDVNLLALAEGMTGNASDRARYTVLHLAEGVRAATILDGEPLRGARGFAGEIGLAVLPVASRAATGVAGDDRGADDRGTDAPLRLQDLLGRSALGRVDERGGADAVARRIAEVTSLIATILDPECVVLGGPVGAAGGTDLARRVRAELASLVPIDLDVRPTGLGADAVVDGAVAIAAARLRDDVYGT